MYSIVWTMLSQAGLTKVNEKFVFIILYLNISTFILQYVHNLTI